VTFTGRGEDGGVGMGPCKRLTYTKGEGDRGM